MFMLEVTGEWAGCVGGWRPAIDGTMNQSGLSALEASTFDTFGEAIEAKELCECMNESNVARFRIIERAE
jgi:hypothetical protein